MSTRVEVSWEQFQQLANDVAIRWRGCGIKAVHGVPRGGLVPAAHVAAALGLPLVDDFDRFPRQRVLVVDDLVDSGATALKLGGSALGAPFDALMRKPHSPRQVARDAVEVSGWVVFPWEAPSEQLGPADAVVRLLEHIGEDPNRDGLVDTPARVLRSLTEMTAGYSDDVGAHLNVQFDVPTHGGLVLVDGIQFTSLCEHHMLPFVGTAAVGYRPGERVVGLSKLARTVHTFAKRLQVQERMTEQIADALDEHLEPEGAGVVIRATHSCMAARGALQPASSMQTQAFRGSLSDSERALILASV